ncbi:universal stress protein [Enterococcus dongliensis]|uniref:Universal stress protein n=1 Tax=Enterococcus dongliensis TaxID=2559925 RepID=A0AAP5KTN4_9ENTE|nr:universal stress protein [Enterococcus dongliensis]MDT2595694.1 universal stress protein [Enterococcus dongliensis]MDT2602654.1 universal stress protein [Enterococcus dongliensis]MDT2633858.1 universal stress protein [Enterococcus dongliensis]MDT2636306.1 universal stress protein [Enterococcus dongliensis]MDT2640412.1 universal stress protein [Enterococcus dongliensis]
MKESYKNILVAVDGSTAATKAFTEALKVAKRNEAKLFILTVVDYRFSIGDPAFINDALKFHLNNAEIEMGQLIADSMIEEIDYETKIDSGNPKRKIIDYALENQADLIIVGATGRGAVEQAFVGTTADYVVNHAHCNVMVVKS